MAARLTERKKKKIVADYIECESYAAAGKRNGVCGQTVRRCVEESKEFSERLAEKKERDAADILAYMDARRDKVCEIIQLGLDALCDPDKLKSATPAQITTALGTLIDKWTMAGNPLRGGTESIEIKTDNPDVARWLKNDD